jgi:hypothetical protein
MTAKLKAADLPLFVSAWFPYASDDILRDLTYFTGWMFLVDDQLDQLSGPDEASAAAFKALTSDTITYIEHSLGVKPSNRPLNELYPGVESFKETGEALCKRYNLSKLLNDSPNSEKKTRSNDRISLLILYSRTTQYLPGISET